MADLESLIDDLYRGPFEEFIPARSLLASSLKGADQQQVKKLRKPTTVPWAVNQVYWHARAVFDRAARAGADLRRAQVKALAGRSADLRAATEAHRTAIAAAVAQAARFADVAHINPDRDAIARTLEALTLTSAPPTPGGRLTEALQPGGFEMLAGIPVRGKSGSLGPAGPPRSSTKEARRRAAVIKQAEAELVRARKGEAEATRHWDRMRDKVERARKAWEEAREKVQKTERALAELRTQP